MRRPWKIFALGTLLGLGMALPAGLALAGKLTPPEVRSPEQLCTRFAKHGKASITPLAQGENAFLGRLEIAPGAQVPEHRDETEEYIHVVSGSGTLTIDDKKYAIGPGSTVFMPAHAKVSFENGKSAMTALQVFAGPGPASKYATWTGCP